MADRQAQTDSESDCKVEKGSEPIGIINGKFISSLGAVYIRTTLMHPYTTGSVENKKESTQYL